MAALHRLAARRGRGGRCTTSAGSRCPAAARAPLHGDVQPGHRPDPVSNSQVRQAVELREAANSDLDTARRAAVQDARTAYLQLNSELARGKALEAAERSSRLALDSNRFGYEVGMRINIDVLNVQEQLFETQTQLSRIRYETILNGLRLKAAAGSLDEADVEQVNRLLRR